ncbi:MAG TPA: PqqD family protein [Candidatus Dormibacteraeota bacterium]|nr:PqqD family protein [Candidatus Dormibacteraeota bacterium]
MTRLSSPRRNGQVIAQKGSSNFLLFNMGDGNYYSLNEVGGRIWELSDGHHTVGQIVDILAAEYEAPAEALAQDALELLDELRGAKLVVEAG